METYFVLITYDLHTGSSHDDFNAVLREYEDTIEELGPNTAWEFTVRSMSIGSAETKAVARLQKLAREAKVKIKNLVAMGSDETCTRE